MDQTRRFAQTGCMFLIPIFLMVSVVFAKDHPDFQKTSRSVTWRGQKLKGVDPATFEAPCPPEFEARKGDALFCAADSKRIYLGRMKAKLDLWSFERAPVKELGKNHFQIGRQVFFRDFTHALPNADFATFNELEEENETGIDSRRIWASDHRDVYCRGEVVTGLSPRDLAIYPFLSWDCKNLVSPQMGDAVPATGYVKDSSGVFIYVDCKLQSRLADADPATFAVPSILFPSRARDGKGNLYNCGMKTSRKRAAVD